MVLTITTFSLSDQFNDLVKMALSEQQTLTENSKNIHQEVIDESAKSQNFFNNNKSLERKCITTRIKSRNFLSNVLDAGINKEDFCNENFIFDVC